MRWTHKEKVKKSDGDKRRDQEKKEIKKKEGDRDKKREK